MRRIHNVALHKHPTGGSLRRINGAFQWLARTLGSDGPLAPVEFLLINPKVAPTIRRVDHSTDVRGRPGQQRPVVTTRSVDKGD